jgi:hypothetical protein
MPEIRQARSERDAAIVEQFKQTNSIIKTREALGFVYSREIVRRAITKAGLYSKCKRDAELIRRAEQRKDSILRCHTQVCSRTHNIELDMQVELERNLAAFGVNFKREMLVPGCQMRADFCGDNWAIETKVNGDSQSMMLAMAQCMVYRKHLNKPHVSVVIPDDVIPRDFYKRECESNGVAVLKLSNLIWWINSLGTDA